VDDGKSTLIGRLLYDSRSLMEDQIEALERSADLTGGGRIDLSNLTDGLRAEREQGITIDVAYRYFATPRRRFIIADTPGHVQYTRNMVTGASAANLAIVLVDAREGVTEQSRRHTCIAALLRIPHLVIAVNKMDLVDWSEERFIEIRDQFEEFLPRLDVKDVQFIPLSALTGDNVVEPSRHTPWYPGPTLLGHLEASTSAATGISTACACPSNGSTARTIRLIPSCTTSAGSAARSPGASCASARRSWCCPAAWSAP
jgi:sulfate adenylyltransferase subunit 1